MEPEQPQSTPARSNGHRCPACGGAASPESDTFPFCSVRCRMVDLGRWFNGQYTVSREMTEDDMDDPTLNG